MLYQLRSRLQRPKPLPEAGVNPRLRLFTASARHRVQAPSALALNGGVGGGLDL